MAWDAALTLNAAPDVKATGKITAHLIPSLDLGISALGGKAEAQVSLALDTNAALTLSLEGSASASLTKNIPIAGKDSVTKASVKPPTFGGCVGVDANINVNVGADASFFGKSVPSLPSSSFRPSFSFARSFRRLEHREGPVQ
jgi:hypothetical protein